MMRIPHNVMLSEGRSPESKHLDARVVRDPSTPRPFDSLRAAPLRVTAGAARDDKDLRAAAEQLESVFVEQLFKAMRATVPQGEGTVTASSGEELFTGLMDQHLAAETPAQWSSGIADALYRQLLPRIAPSEPNSSTP
jgi:peptidoglycan hydrolase FlgJ